jgi:hypothetical protein
MRIGVRKTESWPKLRSYRWLAERLTQGPRRKVIRGSSYQSPKALVLQTLTTSRRETRCAGEVSLDIAFVLIERHPHFAQSSPRLFFKAMCSAINSARTSSLVCTFFSKNSIRFCFSST